MWISKKKFKALEKRIADLEGQVQSQQVEDCYKKQLSHIESLLQRIPELIALSVCIEQEKKDELLLQGKKYSKTVNICPIEGR